MSVTPDTISLATRCSGRFALQECTTLEEHRHARRRAVIASYVLTVSMLTRGGALVQLIRIFFAPLGGRRSVDYVVSESEPEALRPKPCSCVSWEPRLKWACYTALNQQLGKHSLETPGNGQYANGAPDCKRCRGRYNEHPQ